MIVDPCHWESFATEVHPFYRGPNVKIIIEGSWSQLIYLTSSPFQNNRDFYRFLATLRIAILRTLFKETPPLLPYALSPIPFNCSFFLAGPPSFRLYSFDTYRGIRTYTTSHLLPPTSSQRDLNQRTYTLTQPRSRNHPSRKFAKSGENRILDRQEE